MGKDFVEDVVLDALRGWSCLEGDERRESSQHAARITYLELCMRRDRSCHCASRKLYHSYLTALTRLYVFI